MWFNREDGLEEIDRLSSKNSPFLFIISFDKSKFFVSHLDNLDSDILYKIEDKSNSEDSEIDREIIFHKYPIGLKEYREKLERVIEEIKNGNTYLLNLTFKTKIEINLSLKDIYHYSKAPFKLYFKNEFVCFSPEKFIEIEDRNISTYPMKGTIDSNIENAKEILKKDTKELAEHTMIVDLMRNDLSIIADRVRVKKFRYTQEIDSGKKRLLQNSSKICGVIREGFRFGEIIDNILPAGSISGTPKRKTIEIINDIEDYDRGFYTGVFGICEDNRLNSSVMIRFIEKKDNELYYKSGGGITLNSDTQKEYQEMIDKIYLPF